MNYLDSLDEFTRAYIECALFRDFDVSGRRLSDNYSPEDFDPSSLNVIAKDCTDFQRDNSVDLAGLNPEQCGHDFWLMRNGYDAEFLNRGLGERFQRLAAAARAYGSC